MQRTKPPSDARILRIREYEDKLARLQQSVKETSHLGTVASWEAKAEDKLTRSEVDRRLDALKARREAGVDARRNKLAERLYVEEQALKDELLSIQETPEQRRAAMANRARELAAARESQRQQLAQQLMDQAFRESCDPLRERYSKQIVYSTVEERAQQIQEKLATRLLQAEETRAAEAMYAAEATKKDARYDQGRARQAAQKVEVARTLQEQVAAVAERRADEDAQRQRDIAEMQAAWQRMEREEEEAVAAERENMRLLAAEVKEFNKRKQQETAQEERRERDEDLAILQEALAREEAEEAREQEARERKRAEVLRYRDQLASMMQKEAEDNADRDAMIESVLAVKQAEQDAVWAAREAARKRLMAEVDAIRRQQIHMKQSKLQLLAQQQQLERLRLQEDEAEEALAAEQRRNAARRKALQQQLDIQTQIMAKSHMRAAEEDEVQRAQETAKQAETQYMARVQAAEQTIAPPKYFGRKKVEWFH